EGNRHANAEGPRNVPERVLGPVAAGAGPLDRRAACRRGALVHQEPVHQGDDRARLGLPARPRRELALAGGDAKLIEKYAADNPITWYHEFLINTVIPNAHIFGHLTALGEAAVGISLTFGFLTVLGSIGGLIEVIFYGMAVQHMSSGQQGFHVMLFSMMVVFL